MAGLRVRALARQLAAGAAAVRSSICMSMFGACAPPHPAGTTPWPADAPRRAPPPLLSLSRAPLLSKAATRPRRGRTQGQGRPPRSRSNCRASCGCSRPGLCHTPSSCAWTSPSGHGCSCGPGYGAHRVPPRRQWGCCGSRPHHGGWEAACTGPGQANTARLAVASLRPALPRRQVHSAGRPPWPPARPAAAGILRGRITGGRTQAGRRAGL